MAETDQQERTEQPTAKRLQEARERGEVARSRDLAGAAVTLLVMLALVLATWPSARGAAALFRIGLDYRPETLLGAQGMTDALASAAWAGLLILALPLAVSVLAALAGTLALGGWVFSGDALTPKPERFNPVKGFKRMFSLRGLVELGKALGKFLVVAAITGILLSWLAPRLGSLAVEPAPAGVRRAISTIGWSGVAIASGLLLIAAVDVPWQWFDFRRRLRMTREELKREQKETDGNPEVRSRIRSLQQQMARRKMMADVPKADVVVTNPTHYAVALRYDGKRARAPVVVAKGAELLAARIREIAVEHRVAILESPPLARALYRHVEIGAEIPAALYLAVAQVLAYVYRLREAARTGGLVPEPPRPEIDPALLGPPAPKD